MFYNKHLIGGRDPNYRLSLPRDRAARIAHLRRRLRSRRNIEEGRRRLESQANVASLSRGTRRRISVPSPNNEVRNRSPERRRSVRRIESRRRIQNQRNQRNIERGQNNIGGKRGKIRTRQVARTFKNKLFNSSKKRRQTGGHDPVMGDAEERRARAASQHERATLRARARQDRRNIERGARMRGETPPQIDNETRIARAEALRQRRFRRERREANRRNIEELGRRRVEERAAAALVQRREEAEARWPLALATLRSRQARQQELARSRRTNQAAALLAAVNEGGHRTRHRARTSKNKLFKSGKRKSRRTRRKNLRRKTKSIKK
jgi:hypothetical protein